MGELPARRFESGRPRRNCWFFDNSEIWRSVTVQRLEAKIRKTEASDIDSVETIISQHWKVNIDHHQEVGNKDAILLVAEALGAPPSSGSPIVGTGLMWVTNWNKTGYLVELAVSKGHLRKGIGKALVNEFARTAKGQQLGAIIVETQPDNRDGMDFLPMVSGYAATMTDIIRTAPSRPTKSLCSSPWT